MTYNIMLCYLNSKVDMNYQSVCKQAHKLLMIDAGCTMMANNDAWLWSTVDALWGQSRLLCEVSVKKNCVCK